MTHRVGDIVRLNRGRTPMIVLHISEAEELYAVYARREDYYRITPWHYKNYREANSYHRHVSDFTAWDGKPINTEWNYIMPRRYRTTKGAPQAGVYMNTTSNGDIILELDSGEIKTFKLYQLEEDIPDTFRVKATENNYSCHYKVPPGVDVQVGDMLISDSNNIYVVLETETKNRNPKGVFKGRRLVTERL